MTARQNVIETVAHLGSDAVLIGLEAVAAREATALGGAEAARASVVVAHTDPLAPRMLRPGGPR